MKDPERIQKLVERGDSGALAAFLRSEMRHGVRSLKEIGPMLWRHFQILDERDKTGLWLDSPCAESLETVRAYERRWMTQTGNTATEVRPYFCRLEQGHSQCQKCSKLYDPVSAHYVSYSTEKQGRRRQSLCQRCARGFALNQTYMGDSGYWRVVAIHTTYPGGLQSEKNISSIEVVSGLDALAGGTAIHVPLHETERWRLIVPGQAISDQGWGLDWGDSWWMRA